MNLKRNLWANQMKKPRIESGWMAKRPRIGFLLWTYHLKYNGSVKLFFESERGMDNFTKSGVVFVKVKIQEII